MLFGSISQLLPGGEPHHHQFIFEKSLLSSLPFLDAAEKLVPLGFCLVLIYKLKTKINCKRGPIF